jgi:hypothetical protein
MKQRMWASGQPQNPLNQFCGELCEFAAVHNPPACKVKYDRHRPAVGATFTVNETKKTKCTVYRENRETNLLSLINP